MTALDRRFREHSARVLATLVRLVGDLDLAEEGLQEAFRAAAETWPVRGVPENPVAWLVSAGRFRALDALRRRRRSDLGLEADLHAARAEPEADEIPDDRLRLILLCCHPSLPVEGQIALTLREVCGLTTEEIAAAFLTPVPTLAQRLVRAKARLQADRAAFVQPEGPERENRVGPVLHVIYLVFNEGYFASRGATALRVDLIGEAVRLARLVAELFPRPETLGLLSLLLLNASRSAARQDAAGDPVLLEDQDRSLWNRELVAEGTRLLRSSFSLGEPGPYALQAAIAAQHAAAASVGLTDWRAIVGLYDSLEAVSPSIAVRTGRAAAVAMRDGPQEGLRAMEALGEELQGYLPGLVAYGEVARRAGDIALAQRVWTEALARCADAPLKKLLERKLGRR